MAVLPRSYNSSSVDQHAGVDLSGRITVDQLLLHHRDLLSDLPGETSHFDQNSFGYEWRCEFRLEPDRAKSDADQQDRRRPLELHFSLMDMDRHVKPAAALCLVETGAEATQHRLFLTLGNLSDTQEQLNEHLLHRDASVAMYENASHFIASLAEFRSIVQDKIIWE